MDAVSGSDRPIKKLLSDLQFLGPLRFIVQGSGAILESVAEVGSVTYKVRRHWHAKGSRARTPEARLHRPVAAQVLDSGAELATLKADTGSSDFEAHVRLSEVSGARFETKDKADGKTLFLIRLINQQGAPGARALRCAVPRPRFRAHHGL